MEITIEHITGILGVLCGVIGFLFAMREKEYRRVVAELEVEKKRNLEFLAVVIRMTEHPEAKMPHELAQEIARILSR